MTTLVIAEKPSVARQFAHTLSHLVDLQQQVTKIYCFPYNFLDSTSFVVTSARGHLMQMDFQDSNKVELAPGNVHMTIIPSEVTLVNQLQSLAASAKYLILATDMDREGERLASDIQEICKIKNVFRICLNEISEGYIKNQLQHPGSLNQNAVSASMVRAEVDLKVGLVMSRKLSKWVGFKASYGPCLTTALSLIQQVNHQKYQQFQNCQNQAVVSINDTETRYRYRKESHLRLMKETKKAILDTNPPGLNTVLVFQYAAMVFGMSVKQTADALESLYLKGLVSYPRTESTNYSASVTYTELYKHFTAKLGLTGCIQAQQFYGVDMKDHEPITPLISKHKPEGFETDLLDFIVKYFVLAMSQAGKADQYHLEYHNDVNEPVVKTVYVWHHTGLLSHQTHAFYWRHLLNLENYAVMLQVFDPLFSLYDFQSFKLQVSHPSEDQIETEHLGHQQSITEAELIQHLASHHIGTDSTLPSHFRSLVTSGYTAKQDGYVLTKQATTVLSALNSELKDTQLRHDMKQVLSAIEQGTITAEAGRSQLFRVFSAKIQAFDMTEQIHQKIASLGWKKAIVVNLGVQVPGLDQKTDFGRFTLYNATAFVDLSYLTSEYRILTSD